MFGAICCSVSTYPITTVQFLVGVVVPVWLRLCNSHGVLVAVQNEDTIINCIVISIASLSPLVVRHVRYVRPKEKRIPRRFSSLKIIVLL